MAGTRQRPAQRCAPPAWHCFEPGQRAYVQAHCHIAIARTRTPHSSAKHLVCLVGFLQDARPCFRPKAGKTKHPCRLHTPQPATGLPGRPLRLTLAAAAGPGPLPGDDSASGGPEGDAGGVRYPDVYQGRSYADPVDGLAGSADTIRAREASGRDPCAEAGARSESEVFAETYQARMPRIIVSSLPHAVL